MGRVGKARPAILLKWIPGAERFANAWVIPDTATKPTDPRKDRRRKE